MFRESCVKNLLNKELTLPVGQLMLPIFVSFFLPMFGLLLSTQLAREIATAHSSFKCIIKTWLVVLLLAIPHAH